MKRLKTLASALVLLTLTISVPHAYAARKPHLLKSVTSIAISHNSLTKDNKRLPDNLHSLI